MADIKPKEKPVIVKCSCTGSRDVFCSEHGDEDNKKK